MASDIVWITGASEGIGRSLALELDRRGRRVVASARNAERLATLSSETEGRIVGKPCDVTDAVSLARVVAEIEAEVGPISLAVLNAGVYTPMAADAFDLDVVRRTIEVNLMGVMNGLAPILPLMLGRGAGHIAIVASVAGYGGLPKSMSYGATKAALINLAEGLRFDLAPAGVKIQVVNPGFVETRATAVNDFAMPDLMKAEDAARAFADGLESEAFEIAFPKRFTRAMKLVNLLPYSLYFRVVGRSTGKS